MSENENESVDPNDHLPPNTRWLYYVVASIRRYRFLVLLSTGLGMCFGLLVALTTPNQYRSIGKLLVRPGLREAATPESAFSDAGGAVARASAREGVQNELQVLAAPLLFEKVVDRFGADQVLAPYDPLAGKGGVKPWFQSLPHAFQSWWFRSVNSGASDSLGLSPKEVARMVLSKRVRMYAELGTNVITIEYKANSPELARDVIDATLGAAIDVHRDVFNASSSLGAVERELQKAELVARTAEESLRKFRKDKGIFDHEVQRNKLLDDLGVLRHQVDTIDVDVERKKAEIDILNTLLKTIPKDRVISGSQAFVLNPAYASLNAFLLQLRELDLALDAERKDLSQQEFENRRARLAKLIEEIRIRLQQEGLQLKVDAGREENPYSQLTKQSIDDRVVLVVGLAKQREELAQLSESLGATLADFEAMLPALSALELGAKQKRSHVSHLADGVASMLTAQRLEQLNLSNIQVMHPGTIEPLKIGPQRGKNVLLVGFAGCVIGAMLALMLTWRERRVCGEHDLVMLGVPAEAVSHGETSRRGRLRNKTVVDSLPPAFREVGDEISRFWASVPYDRQSTEGLKIAFVPCGQEPNASLAAATLAAGLATFGGESVVYVSCASDDNWLSRRLPVTENPDLPVAENPDLPVAENPDLPVAEKPGSVGMKLGLGSVSPVSRPLEVAEKPGWSEVIRNGGQLEQAIVATSISGLSYLPMGQAVGSAPHPIAGPAFVALLEQLASRHRFVVMEMPDLDRRPEVQSVLFVVDAAELVICTEQTTKDSVREAVVAIKAAGARMLGTVFQSVSTARSS